MHPLTRTTVDRPTRPVTILQFGSGNFLRGFADWMIQQANDAGLTNHGVAIAYATHRATPRHDPLVDQDGLYHVCLEGMKDGRPTRRIDLVDVVQQLIDPWRDADAFRAVALSEDLRLVISNTTEAGITWSEDDLTVRPAASFPGQVAQLLHDRYLAFGGRDDAGLSILCCELIEDNGETLRRYVVRHAERAGWGEDFLAWLDRANRFYDTLVDRIVSGFPAADAEALFAEIGFADQALVKGELFSLWVIGGDASLRDLLPLDRLDLGVSFVPRAAVAPFRDKKVRILNGCHTAMAQLGLQLGFDTVGAAFADPDLRRLLTGMVTAEVLPTIPGDADDLRRFAAAIMERFDNPYLAHRLADIALNSASKWRTRNLPVVRDRWAAGQEAPLSVLSLAALLVLYSGHGAAPRFEPRDEPRVVATIRDTFDLDELDAWVSRCLGALDLSDLPQAGRLAAEVTRDADALLTDGPRAVAHRAAQTYPTDI